ncbi:ribosome recycling factor [Candidatus Blochmanniella floridana]|uniref:Ribosome-recycling factor n=1 Tax=Blochmanniella floridana TaxID=203907 RepID=RRF_BLOFL|nr:RecName: Full=Ribosome-recycling factor; Short=RRF; AltName: Full=Ribosome-releasing factor [Candidatus Blochmannia floridanus]CAD83345.1 ribosome recycling factor [Candidatus Blochmannia floridanus]
MSDIIDDFQKDVTINMQKCIDNFKININKIHVGRISPDILSFIKIEYYGVITPLCQLTNTVVEQPRTLIITVFDSSMIKFIEKAILESNLGCTPVSTGNTIRVTFPTLTESRRYSLIKMVRSESEKSKVLIRNIRRVSNDKLKTFLRNKEINKDNEHYFQNEIQNLTDIWIKKIILITKEKELELMKF